MGNALKVLANTTHQEYVEKIPFNESDGEEFESPSRQLPLPKQRLKAKALARRMTIKLERAIGTLSPRVAAAMLSDSDSDNLDEGEKKNKRAVNIFSQIDSSEEEVYQA